MSNGWHVLNPGVILGSIIRLNLFHDVLPIHCYAQAVNNSIILLFQLHLTSAAFFLITSNMQSNLLAQETSDTQPMEHIFFLIVCGLISMRAKFLFFFKVEITLPLENNSKYTCFIPSTINLFTI